MRNLIAILLTISFFQLEGQNVWTTIENEYEIIQKNNSEREIIPTEYMSYSLDLDLVRFKLSDAPSEKDKKRWEKAVLMDLPMPDGTTETFSFVESPVMSPVLAAKFPEIKSYRGVAIRDHYKKARIDFSPSMGFHAAIRTAEGTVYVDPYFANADEHYISYFTKNDIPDLSQYHGGVCGMDAYEEEIYGIEHGGITDQERMELSTRSSNDQVVKRNFRFAVSCTGEWGQIFGTVDNVMARIVTGTNRLNQILENEAAIFFLLVDNNDQLIALDPDTDNFDPGPEGEHLGRNVLGQNTAVINSIIGADAYDVGHVFTINCTDGIAGVAQFGSACNDNKGAGLSCVGNSNISNFVASVVAHEVGHQFACGHTWATCPPSSGQFAAGSAFEPGSGSTILSYQGLCQAANNLPTAADYYHVGSLQQIYDHVNISVPDCGVLDTTDNTCPVVTLPEYGSDFIPIGTPFELIGDATDAEGDPLTFSWEQYDAGGGFTLGEQSLTGPQFIIQPQSANNKVRLIPNQQNLLSNNWFNNPFEVMPFGNRRYTFRFVARDNHPEAGIASWATQTFNSTDEAGPFRVIPFTQTINAEVGKEVLVEWDVANTDGDRVNCQFVDIYLSTNGGADFDYLLVENTPNDGSQSVVMPNRISNLVRFKVKASNNIFFHISFPNIRIVEPTEPGFFFDLGELSADVCLPENVEIPIQGTSFQDFANEINLEVVDGLPAGAVANFESTTILPTEGTTLTLDLQNVNETGTYDVVVRGTAEDADTISQTFSLTITGTDFSDLSLVSPASGTVQSGIETFEWTPAQNADSYTYEIATNPSFSPESIVEVATGLTETTYVPINVLEKSTLYYWRVRAENKCTDQGSSQIFAYATEALSCQILTAEDLPKNITQSGAPTIESKTFIPGGGQVSDFNVRNVSGIHQNSGDLTFTMVSPSGTEVMLYDRLCFSIQDFNAGFDDESSVAIDCPLGMGRVFQPVEPLSTFNGETIEGDWIFRIQDNSPGNGGSLQNLEFEICSNQSLAAPILINNETLTVRRGFGRYIEDISLLTTDDNNSNDELIYTLVRVPEFGVLSSFGTVLNAGDQWTQKNITDLNLRYNNDGSTSDVDGFEFTVVDGEGGWVGITTFNIDVSDDDSTPTAADDITVEQVDFKIFPNPTHNLFFIQNKNSDAQEIWKGELFDITGRPLRNFNVDRNQIARVEVGDLTQGVYIVKLQNGNQIQSYSVTVVR